MEWRTGPSRRKCVLGRLGGGFADGYLLSRGLFGGKYDDAIIEMISGSLEADERLDNRVV